MTSRFVSRLAVVALGGSMLALMHHAAVDAKTLRWAGRGDSHTLDPVAQIENLTNNINFHLYDALVHRDRDLQIVPALAISWEQTNATTWRFKLRRDVRFHDGTPFDADDVIFSFQRASEPTSVARAYALASGRPRKIDDYTVEFVTEGPNPIELEHIFYIPIMSKAWCEKHGVTKPLDFKNIEETHAARHANGTGAFVLESREPDVKTVLTRNPNWWGWKDSDHDGNVTRLVYTPISNDATRLAALVAGDVDLVNDPAPQDIPRLSRTPGVRLIEGIEQRVIFIGMDQRRDELLYSSVKGKNPFKDRRVRLALYHAIDIKAIHEQTMRGLSQPTGGITPSPLPSTPEIEKRFAFAPERSRKLLAEAGYPEGFEVTLDCPNNRYVNDEKICQALAAMWSKVGVATRLVTMPRAQYFPKLEKLDTSLYLLGWGGGSTDAAFVLQPLLHSYSGEGDGDYNYGRYRDGKLDALVDQVMVEMNPQKRLALIRRALEIHRDAVYHLPLHRQVVPWAARTNVEVPHRADNQVWATRARIR